MSLISLQNSSELEVTILSNRFIDNFMPRANGEFVKVYIYLLRAVSSSPSSFSLEHMADRLFCTERDIFRALKYWEGEKILSLTYTTDRQLSGITLLEPFADAGHMESSASSENIFFHRRNFLIASFRPDGSRHFTACGSYRFSPQKCLPQFQ